MGAGRVSRRQRRSHNSTILSSSFRLQPEHQRQGLARRRAERDGELATVIVSSTDVAAQRPLLASPPPPRPGAGTGASWSSAATPGHTRSALFLVGCQVAWPSDQLRRRQADGGVRATVTATATANAALLPSPGPTPSPTCDFTANLTPGRLRHHRRRPPQSGRRSSASGSSRTAESWPCTSTASSSGANLLQGLAAGFRYYVFSKELPLVLKAVVHGDGLLFAEHPELLEAKVWGHFHSSSNKYNRPRVLGNSQGGCQRQEAFAATAQRQTAQDPGHHLQRPARPSFDFIYILSMSMHAFFVSSTGHLTCMYYVPLSKKKTQLNLDSIHNQGFHD
ncbi:hypothetical protein GUJ93_ZPchr0458g22507 [Zizania palustris]|uniref:Staygreen protein domain-containing protein n=1 Tax=Zizania palustris TaxID=103762 RepID=A0A8J5R7T4_ZIZPA|nr:hypothetical protein GUJ93_ZPchr0458g22507 [Zizania palustris]